MKTTLDLPDDLVQHIKIQAVQKRIPIKRLVANLLVKGLESADAIDATGPPPLPAGLELNSDGLPVFRSTQDAPATKMTTEELLAIEQQTQQEEDLERAGLSR